LIVATVPFLVPADRGYEEKFFTPLTNSYMGILFRYVTSIDHV
jgi:hypothetical protein